MPLRLARSQVATGDAFGEGDDAKLDELAKGKLWSLLMNALDAAKVSIFFAVFLKTVNFPSSPLMLLHLPHPQHLP